MPNEETKERKLIQSIATVKRSSAVAFIGDKNCGGELENTVQQGSIWRNEIKCINLDAYLRTTMWVAKQTTFGLVRIFGLAERMKRL
ncbi:hypothetical protein V6Z12_D08G197300 [Gossypium hirsutum]